MALLKSGWMWRQSSVLRHWRKNWFDLWMDGSLVYYQGEDRRDMEDKIHLKIHCTYISTGYECTDGTLPQECSRECMLLIHLRDGSKLRLCADSADDAMAWKLAFLETRSNPVIMYNPADESYQTVSPDAYHNVYISPGYHGFPWSVPSSSRVFAHYNPYHNAGDQIALGMLAGLATCAALRMLIWMPCWF